MTEDERAIRELIDAWLAATKAGDLQAVLSLMTEDVVFMVPGAAPFGRDAFAESFSAMAGVRLDGRSEIQELQILGDWAYLRNLIDMIVSPPGGAAPVRRAGHTLTILRKCTDGRWRLSRDANLMAVA
jgi:uncharacterized protein (TIGR02246 family)